MKCTPTPTSIDQRDEVAERAGTTPEHIAPARQAGHPPARRRRDLSAARRAASSLRRRSRCAGHRRERRGGCDRVGRSDPRLRRDRGATSASFGPNLRRAERRDRRPVRDARTHLRRVRAAAPDARRARARGGSAPHQVHPRAGRRRIERRGRLAAGARVGGQRPAGRAVPEPLPAPLHRGAVPPARARDNAAFEAALREVGVRSGRSGEDMLGWLYRRHSEVFETEHHFEHVETALEDAGVHRKEPRQSRPACSRTSPGTRR